MIALSRYIQYLEYNNCSLKVNFREINTLDFDRFRHKVKLYQLDIHHKKEDTIENKSPINPSLNNNTKDFNFVMNNIFNIDKKISIRFVLEN